MGVILEWIGSNLKEDPAVIMERTSRVVHGNILLALDAFPSAPFYQIQGNDKNLGKMPRVVKNSSREAFC